MTIVTNITQVTPIRGHLSPRGYSIHKIEYINGEHTVRNLRTVEGYLGLYEASNGEQFAREGYVASPRRRVERAAALYSDLL